MPNNERLPQKSSTRGTTSRKTGVNAAIPINTTREQTMRDTQYAADDDDDLLMEDDPDASNPPRLPSSAIRLNPPIARRGTRDVTTETRRSSPNVPPRRTQKQDFGPLPPSAARPARTTTSPYDLPPARKGRRSVHWAFYVGLSLFAAVALWALGMNLINWGTNEYNNIVYGYPRTYQTDAVVGHNDSVHNPSHFIAVNLHGQIIIFEMPGGDPSKSIDYIGPDLIVPGSDQLPVTLSFSDVNHDGKVDMIVRVSGQNFVFYNTGTKFAANNSN